MKIKKFKGRSFPEAFAKMKKELGNEAIILDSRRVKESGKIDFSEGEGSWFEVTAGIDGAVMASAPHKEEAAVYERPSRSSAAPVRPYSPPVIHQPEIPSSETIRPETVLQEINKLGSLREDVRDIRRMMDDVSEMIKYSRMPALPPIFKQVMKQLVGREVNEQLAKAIVQTVYSRTEPKQYQQPAAIRETLVGVLKQIIKTAPPLQESRHRPNVVVLIGPTGVGKTTTVAKLAATMKLFHQMQVGLISADTYRIAAIEQLQTFANIASIPMSVVYTPGEMRQAVMEFRNKDVILIDTVGRSQKNGEQLKDLERFIEAAEPNEIHLVLSLTASLRTLLDIVKRFRDFRPNRLLFTKLDESDAAGMMLNVLYKNPIPISYITTGQTVPNDILSASPEQLIRMIYDGEGQ